PLIYPSKQIFYPLTASFISSKINIVSFISSIDHYYFFCYFTIEFNSKLIYHLIHTHILLCRIKERENIMYKDVKFKDSFIVTLHNDLVQADFTDNYTMIEQKV